MTDEIEMAPVQEAVVAPAAAPPPEPQTEERPGNRRHLLAGAAALVAVLGVLGVFGYRAASMMREELVRLDERVAVTLAQQRELQAALDMGRAQAEVARREVEQRIAEQDRGLQAHRQALAQQQIRLDEEREHARQQAAGLHESVAALHRRFGRDSARWMAAEAEYLMQVAGQRLALAQDPLTALEALRLADRRLQETGDPGWMGVRELLAEETAALAALRLPDVPALAAELAKLGEQAAAFRPRSLGATPVADPASGVAPGEGAWRRVLRDGWDGFRSLVVVRRHDAGTPALLPPDQAYFLGQNLQLQIEAARLALLRGDTATYRGSLDAARQLLAAHFETADPAVAAARDSLERLTGVELRPMLPDVTRSLRALRARDRQIADLQGREVP